MQAYKRSTRCLSYGPSDCVPDGLQSAMQSSAFNFAGISFLPCLAWNNIRNVNICCLYLNGSSLRDFFELHFGPRGLQSCKNISDHGVQLQV